VSALPHYKNDREYEAENIHKYRVARGLTVYELSKIAGVSVGSICQLANGSMSPLYEYPNRKGEIKPIAFQLAEALGVSVSVLFPRYICAPKQPMATYEQITDGLCSSIPSDPEKLLIDKEERICDVNEQRWSIVYDALDAENNPYRCRMFKILYLLGQGYSLSEIGEFFNMSRQRMHVIERQALLLLRNPIRNIMKKWTVPNYKWRK